MLSYHALKLEGDMYIEFKDFKNAIQKYKRLKSFCDDRKQFREKIVCYGQLGLVYTLLDDYNTAIKYFHK